MVEEDFARGEGFFFVKYCFLLKNLERRARRGNKNGPRCSRLRVTQVIGDLTRALRSESRKF